MDANQANPCLVCGNHPIYIPVGIIRTYILRCEGCPPRSAPRHNIMVSGDTQAEALLLWNKAQPAQGGS